MRFYLITLLLFTSHSKCLRSNSFKEIRISMNFSHIVLFSNMDVSITAECRISALGMESGEIDDAQLSASSSFDMISVGPQNAR